MNQVHPGQTNKIVSAIHKTMADPAGRMISLSLSDDKCGSAITKVANAVLGKGKVVIISGAGISVSCGIPVRID